MPLFETPTEPAKPSATPNGEETGTETSVKQPVVVVAGRHGEWDSHELIRLLDTIEDERARGRFRESLYISIFVWIVVTWFIFYGPRVLWHAPQLRDPASVLKERELTQLTLPPSLKSVVPAPRPAIDKATMERLKSMTRPAPSPTPAPVPAATPNAPVAQPMPATPPPPPPPVAQPRLPQPVADAPTAQPTKPNFGSPTSAGNSIQQALNAAAKNRSGGDVGAPSHRSGGPLNLGGAEVLSDTQGVDFDAYLRRILSDIKRNWDPLIPAEAESPLFKQGETWIRFTINPDGSIAAMHLDGSSHDEAINRSCWGSITSEGQFPPLPSQFHGPNLELRIHYLVNKQPQQE
jgi:outer membrane biosynthesis protein TonB